MLRLLLLISSFLLASCANLEENHRNELRREITPEYGLLVIVRDAGLTLANDIQINGVTRCQLDEKNFCLVRLMPGKYTVNGSGYFGKPPTNRKIGMQIDVLNQDTSFILIDSKLDSGYVIPLPGFIAAGATTSTRFAKIDIQKYLSLRFLLKRVDPISTPSAL